MREWSHLVKPEIRVVGHKSFHLVLRQVLGDHTQVGLTLKVTTVTLEMLKVLKMDFPISVKIDKTPLTALQQDCATQNVPNY